MQLVAGSKNAELFKLEVSVLTEVSLLVFAVNEVTPVGWEELLSAVEGQFSADARKGLQQWCGDRRSYQNQHGKSGMMCLASPELRPQSECFSSNPAH